MLNALTYVFSNELRRPLVWQTVSSIPPVIKEEPFRAKPDQSRFRFTTSPYISEEDQQGEDARKATRERTIGMHKIEFWYADTISWKQTLAAYENEKKNKTEPKRIEKKGSRTSKGCRDIDAKQKERQATTSRRPYCCYLVLGVA